MANWPRTRILVAWQGLAIICSAPGFWGQRGEIYIETPFFLLLGALGFGIAHAFEPDHMAAVSTFVANRPAPRQAALFGVRWALGHGFSLFVIGFALFLLRRAAQNHQPALWASGFLERVVGVVLVILGFWTLRQVVSRRASRPHQHGVGHAHDGENASHSHAVGAWGSLGMGVLHGAAGTGAFVGQSVVALSSSLAFVALYTALFSLGVLVSMGVYAGALGGLISLGEKRGQKVLGGARVLTGVLTCAIGFCLVVGIELPGLFSSFGH